MADTKISGLTAVTVPAETDELAVNQSGTSKKMTLNQVSSFTLTNGDVDPGSFATPTGSFALMVQHLILTSTERTTLQGTARLRII